MSEFLLSQVSTIISAKAPISEATLDNYISTENMIPLFGGVTKAEKLPQASSINTFKSGDILFSNIRTYFKKVWFSNFNGTVSPDVLVFRANEKICLSKYLFYTLCNSEFIELSILTSKGAKMPRGDKEAMLKYSFTLPPLPEQQAIAEVLSSLDDKIDLLHRNNKTLEEMAETLLKRACVNSKTILLGDIIEIHDNKRIPLSSIQRAQKKEGKLYPYYGAATIMDYVNEFIFDGDYILIGEDGTVQTEDGFPVLQRLIGKAWVNNHTHVINAIAPYNNDILEMILKNTSVSHIVTGAVQPKINQGSLKSLEVIVPNNDIDVLGASISTLMNKRESNNRQIGSLKITRDTLLPKLMSGQVRVQA